MAMLTISKEASVKRANPVKTYPSTTSITPLIKGTPGYFRKKGRDLFGKGNK